MHKSMENLKFRLIVLLFRVYMLHLNTDYGACCTQGHHNIKTSNTTHLTVVSSFVFDDEIVSFIIVYIVIFCGNGFTRTVHFPPWSTLWILDPSEWILAIPCPIKSVKFPPYVCRPNVSEKPIMFKFMSFHCLRNLHQWCHIYKDHWPESWARFAG